MRVQQPGEYLVLRNLSMLPDSSDLGRPIRVKGQDQAP
jgi:hypothetical protein